MIKVAGNNLAAIVCCSELVRHGIRVQHITNNDFRLGGHFAGVLYKEKRIDLGMVLLEPRFDLTETDIVQYQGQFGQQVNQFNHAVFGWLNSRNILLNPITVLSYFKNKLIGDVIIADDLSFLNLLPSVEREVIIEELTIRIIESKHHPRDKAHSPYFQETSLQDVYYEIYGPSFSNYLLGNLELLTGSKGAEVVAQFHRLLWAPLYYPESILSYLKNGDSGIPLLDFFVPSDNSISQLINNITDEMKQSSIYLPQPLPSDEYSSMVKDHIQNNSIGTVVFADEREIYRENLNAPGTLIAFVVAQIDSDREFIVHNLDTSSKWYRATIRGQNFGVAVIEIGQVLHNETDASILMRANQCADSVGIDALLEPIILKSNIHFFPPEVSASFYNRHLRLKKDLNGNASCFLTNEITGSFNNQVCLGLSSSQVIIREAIK